LELDRVLEVEGLHFRGDSLQPGGDQKLARVNDLGPLKAAPDEEAIRAAPVLETDFDHAQLGVVVESGVRLAAGDEEKLIFG
jgi:hypothetical protein